MMKYYNVVVEYLTGICQLICSCNDYEYASLIRDLLDLEFRRQDYGFAEVRVDIQEAFCLLGKQ